jgi:hypothetical protein
VRSGRVDRRRRIISNAYEAETHRILESAASRYGALVFPKVRVADVLNLDGSGLTNDQYWYGLRAHFDFTVTDEGSHPLFAVEFDGRFHTIDPETIRRDALKDAICDRFNFPLLRIGDDYFRRIGRFILLGWLAEVWFLDDGFTKAQDRGDIPGDEIFDYGFVLGLAYWDQGRLVEITDLEVLEQLRLMEEHKGKLVPTQPYNPFGQFRAYIIRSFDQGACGAPFPEEIFGTDPAGYQVGVGILPVADGRFIIGSARVKLGNFRAVAPTELAFELSVVEVARGLRQFRNNKYAGCTAAEVEAWRRRLESWCQYR